MVSNHVMPLTLVSASQDVGSIFNGTNAFLRTWIIKMRCCDVSGHVTPMDLALVSYEANAIANGPTVFFRSGQLK